MAIPTITTIDPISGPAAGENLVTITGTNFRVPAVVPSSGAMVGAPAGFDDIPVTVKVYVNGIESDFVQVFSDTEISFRPPVYTGDPLATAFPAVNVQVDNVDDSGVLIPGETVVSTGGYTYTREPLRAPTIPVESPYVRISRLLIEKIKRETIFETGMTTHTDFSADGIITDVSTLPSLYLIGPRVEREPDSDGDDNVSYWEKQPDDSYLRWPSPTLHRFTYDLVGISDSQIELLTLMGAARKIFRRNPYLTITADVPANSSLRMPMLMVGDPEVTSGASNANVRAFSSTFEVRRIPILSIPPDYQAYEIEQLDLEVDKIGATLLETVILFKP